MNKVIDFPKAAAPDRGDGICQEADGCPTERAVLQRFWREHQAENADAERYRWLVSCETLPEQLFFQNSKEFTDAAIDRRIAASAPREET
jgi:hypothetical protein